jgi:hypothetical protein
MARSNAEQARQPDGSLFIALGRMVGWGSGSERKPSIGCFIPLPPVPGGGYMRREGTGLVREQILLGHARSLGKSGHTTTN